MTTKIYHNISKFNEEEQLICDNTSKEIYNNENNQSQENLEYPNKINDQHLKNQKAGEDMDEECSIINSHNSLDNRIHACHICKRKYETTLGLRRHIVRSHSNQILLYKCEKCYQQFRTKMDCNQHKCSNNEKESKISQENLNNVFISNSKKPKNKNINRKEEFVLEIEEIEKLESENDNEEELYSCITCSSVFSSEIKIKKHIENKECYSHELKQKVKEIKQKYKKTLEIFKKAKLHKKKLKEKLVSLGESLGSSDSESDLNEMETLLVNSMDEECNNLTKKKIIEIEKEKTANEMEVKNISDDEIENNDTIEKIVFLESENKEIQEEIVNKEIKTTSFHAIRNEDYFDNNTINEDDSQEESIIFMHEDSQMGLVCLNKQELEHQQDVNNLYDENNEYKVDQLKEEFLTESSSNETCYFENTNEKSKYLLHIDIINDLNETKPIYLRKNEETYSVDYNKEICIDSIENWAKPETIEDIEIHKNGENEIKDYSKMKSETNEDLISKEKYNEKFMSFLYKSLIKEEVQLRKTKKKVRKQQKEIKNQEILNNLTDLKSEENIADDQDNKIPDIELKKSLENKTEKNISNKKLVHQCPYCDKFFSNKSVLDNHTRSHTDERHFSCSYCERKCFDRVSLEIHERRHKNDRRHICEYCDEKFFTLFEKKRHEKTWHQNSSKEISPKKRIRHNMSFDEKRKYGPKALLGEDGFFHCKMCDKICLTAKTMRKHTALHLNGKPCPLCSKVFAYDSALQRHLLVPHEEKNFMCTVCGNRYTSAATLNSHAKVHSKGAIKCPICPKIFGTIYNLGRHMNHKHKLKNWQKIYPDITEERIKEKIF